MMMSGKESTNYVVPKSPHDFWKAAELQIQDTEHHPFLVQMVYGTLPQPNFQYYVIQDALYLHEFADCLRRLGDKQSETNPMLKDRLNAFAVGAEEAELALHKSFFQQWKIDVNNNNEHHANNKPMPNCLLYTSYMKQVVVTETYAQGLAVLLPCFWVYQHVGQCMLQLRQQLGDTVHRPPQYDAWIDMYGGDDFDRKVKEYIQMVDTECKRLIQEESIKAQDELLRMQHHFLMSCKLEHMFWDQALTMMTWGQGPQPQQICQDRNTTSKKNQTQPIGMTRMTFLSCLPYFMYMGNTTTDDNETPTEAWKYLSQLEETGQCTKEILLDKKERNNLYHLSIEPTQWENQTSVGPAYFASSSPPSKDNQGNTFVDPAMAKCELVLYTAVPLDHYDVGKTRLVETITPVKDMKHNERQNQTTPFGGDIWYTTDKDAKKEEIILFMNIDDQKYQFDLTSIQEMEVVGENNTTAGHNHSNNNNNTNYPPCLILKFPSCIFRIFGMSSSSSSSSASNLGWAEFATTLASTKTRLEDIVTASKSGHCRLPFPLVYPSATEEKEENGQINHETTMLGRHFQAYHNAMQQLGTFQQLLSNPSPDEIMDDNNFRNFLSTLLAKTVPHNVSSSFIDNSTLQVAMQTSQDTIAKAQMEMGKTLDTFWKKKIIHSTPNASKRRKGLVVERNQDEIHRDKERVQRQEEECIETTEKLLQDHKQALESKYQLATLPVRK